MARWLSFILVLALAGCGNLPQPFSKDAPLPQQNQLVAPPWEAMVKAGPGAVKQLDLETLNGPQRNAPATPGQVAAADITAEQPPAAKAKVGDEGKPAAKTPKAAVVAIKAVTVLPVTGDSSIGNKQLTDAMRDTLKKAGWPVRAKKGPDTLVITGKVRIGQPHGKAQTVTLAWDVLNPAGKSLGLISQTNDVPAGSLEAGWGDNAAAAVEAAATGIFALIDKMR